MRNKPDPTQSIPQDLPDEELMVIELDERLEFSAVAFVDGNLACNASNCKQNVSCGTKSTS